MEGRRKNTFRKAVRHLKSTQIDEKLQLLSEIPTNNTDGIYIVEPEYSVQDPDVPGSEPVDFVQDDPSLNGRDTTGLFGEDGSILTIEPPGDTSYILGPMMSMWYSWGNFSTIGYVRQSDRRMVDLGRITGQIGSWDGSSNFTSYGQLTLEQANWFKDQSKIQYRAFYPGPPSNSSDGYGRYLGDMISEGKPTSITPPRRRVSPTTGGFDPNLPPGEANPKKKKRDDEIAYGQDEYGKSDYGQKPDGTRGMPRPGELNKGNDGKWYEYVPGSGWQGIPSAGVRSASNRQNNDTQVAQNNWPSGKDAKPSETTPIIPPWGGGPVHPGGRDFQGPSPKNKYPMVKNKNGKNKTQVAHYEPEGKFLSESKKSILKNIKKPYVLPEQPKVKYKVKPGSNRTVNSELMKKAEVPSSFKKAEERVWGKYEKEQNARFSQERKNEILDHLGGGDHAWEYMTETSRKKNDEIMYGNFGGEQKKGKVVRKEQLKGDTLLFIADENGKKESILQSELSIRLADKFNKELFEQYYKKERNDKIFEHNLKEKKSKSYDWREELLKDKKKYFSEGMTSDEMFQTTLDAKGEQTLATGTNLSYGPDSPEPDLYYGVGAGDFYDTRYYDTVVFDVSAGVGPLDVYMDGASVLSNSGGSGTYTFTIPPNLRGKNVNISWTTAIPYETTGYGNWRISNIRFQRRTPMNVFVSLDSPEATSFIRTGSGDLSPEEKQKRLKEMLEASDEYVQQIYGDEFPGSGAVPPGEAGDTPGVETIDYGEDLTPLSDDPYGTEVGQVAGGMSPTAAVNMLTDMINDKMGGNQVNMSVGGQRFSGSATNVRNQIRTAFPGGV